MSPHEVGSSHSEEVVSGLSFQMLVNVSILFDDLLLISIFIERWLENVVCIVVLCNLSYRLMFLCLCKVVFFSPCVAPSLILLGPGLRQ